VDLLIEVSLGLYLHLYLRAVEPNCCPCPQSTLWASLNFLFFEEPATNRNCYGWDWRGCGTRL